MTAVPMRPRAVLAALGLLVVAIAGASTSVAAAAGVAYTYDAMGRLKTVTDPAGAKATYTYDAVGNVLSIARAAAPPAVKRTTAAGSREPEIRSTKVVRASGGYRVIVTGARFDRRRLRNRVRIGGLAAQVTSASASRLVAFVPVLGTRRGVSVTTPAGTASRGPIAKRPSLRRDVPSPADGFGPRPRVPLPPLRAKPGTTALSGRILKLDGTPLAGVTVSAHRTVGWRDDLAHDPLHDLNGNPLAGPRRPDTVVTRSDRTGRYLLEGLDAGHQVLTIDGSTVRGRSTYGRYEQGVDLQRGQTKVLSWFSWLPALDTSHSTPIPQRLTRALSVKTPTLPGLEVRLDKGTVLVDEEGDPVRRLTLTPVPLDRTPVPLAPGMPVFFDLQPGGAYVRRGRMSLVYPNATNQPAGRKVDYLEYDPDAKGMGWKRYGSGTVTADGKQIVPDRRTSVYEVGAHSVSYNPLCDLLGLFCPEAGEDSGDGDPVNLSTGLFTMEKTDLAVPDVMPLAVTRSYRQRDPTLRSFGIGQSDAFSMFIAPDVLGRYDLSLPDGSVIPFEPGPDGVYRSTSTPTEFNGATLTMYSIRDFVVKLKDGTTYTFGTYHAILTAITDRFGNATTFTRDYYSGQLQEVTSPNGRWLRFAWGACSGSSACVTSVTDNIGRSVSYAYDANGRLTGVTDPAGKVTTYTWAACADAITCTEILSIKDPRGITYLTNQYDANGRIARQTEANAAVHQFDYDLDPDGRVTMTTVTDPRSDVRKVGFDAAGYTISDTAAVGSSVQQATTLVRDPTTNHVTSATDPLNRTTTYTYDELGNVTSVTSLAGTADAVTTSFEYEPAFNRVASVTDPLGHMTRFSFDDANNRITTTDPLGRKTIVTTAGGQVAAITDPLGKTSYLSYLNGDLVAIADPLGRVSTRYLDDAGRLIRATDPLGNFTQYGYDALNQVTSAVDPIGGTSTATYDANGNQLTLTDPKSQTTTYVYDAMDQVSSRKDALAKTETVTYDKIGNPKTYTDRNGVVTKFSYDEIGRQTFAGYGASGSTYQSTITSTYDRGDRLTKAVDTTGGTITQTFDALDRLKTQVTPQGTIAYSYDKDGRRRKSTVTGQPAVDYTYDDNDQLKTITQGASVVAVSYDTVGRATKVTLPNGVAQAYTYDAASQLSAITYTKGATLLGTLTYTYDKAGRRTGVGGSYARSDLPAAVASATYDADNAATSFGGAAMTYDSEGRMLSDGSNTYTWNARGELTGIAGATTASFAYDAFGRRQTATVGATATSLLYDGPNVVQELTGTTPKANLLTGLGVDETFTRTDATGARSLLTDALGSTVALTDPAGVERTSYTYEPFGKSSSAGDASANPTQFTGRETDGTGLQYNRARYYSPKLGRFISQDPLGEDASGPNLYNYTFNGPTNFTDPSGEFFWIPLAIKCAVGAAASVGIGKALAGRKYSLGDGLLDAAMGCVGAPPVLKGLGRGASRLKGLRRAEKAVSNVCSFSGDTTVVMADGSRKPMAQVRVGDKVLATDPATGEESPRTVTRIWIHRDRLVRLTIGGAVVRTTEDHPFWNARTGTWRPAAQLRVGDVLGTVGGRHARVGAIDLHRSGRTSAYNLSIETVHTYHVGRVGVLVHNTCMSPNQMNQAIQRGLAPRGIKRVDTPKIPHEKLHVTFDNDAALNIDGTWKHGSWDITNAQAKWLIERGWTLPK